MWTKSLQKKAKSTLPVDERRSKTPMLKLPNIASRDMWVKKNEKWPKAWGKINEIQEYIYIGKRFWKYAIKFIVLESIKKGTLLG